MDCFRYLLILSTTVCAIYSVSARDDQVDKNSVCSDNGSIRLVGFNSTMSGYVEVCREEVWRRVYISGDGSSWSRKNSIVTCRQIGYLNALNIVNNERLHLTEDLSKGGDSNALYYESLRCTGLENKLTDCETSVLNISEPSVSSVQNAFVACTKAPRRGDIRVVGSGSDSEGILQVFHPIRAYGWSTVCTNQWDDDDASVACKQLGYSGGKAVRHRRGSQHLLPRRRYDNYICNGVESTLSECSFDGPYPIRCFSGDNRYAGVVCEGNGQDSDKTIHIEPSISLLVLITGAALLLIAVVAILLRCTVKRFTKKSPSQHSPRSSNPSGQRLSRVTLNPQYWQQNGVYSADAPPTYEETVSAVQVNNDLIENGDSHPTEVDVRTSSNSSSEGHSSNEQCRQE